MASVSLQLAEPPFAHKLDHDYEGGHFMTILSHGAENVHSQVWQRFCWQATQCAVIGLGHKMVSKILWTTCLTSFLVQENIPSCCFLPYLELHCYHHRSHMGLYIILLESSDTHLTVASIYQNIPISPGKSQRLSHGTVYYSIRGLRHTFGSVRNSNFVKQVKYK